ncbi:MAG: thiamine phosphate synthase [Planctomycetes bacterium]|nr:thiamine phosphate synthase [Planctomycetota bacterium]
MREVYRILDANFNRAREALRVAEEYVRFVLDDPALSALAKVMRGRLRTVIESLPAAELLAGRDTEGDVGTTVTTPEEADRPSPAAVATAACKRLGEALRTIEEYIKLIDAGIARDVEQLRYQAYTFEQRLCVRSGLTGRLRRARLCVLLTSDLCRSDPVVTAHAAIAGGADCIQLREKNLPDRQLWDLARRLRALTLQTETLLIINDRPDIAAVVQADGVHVGQDDLPVAEARRIVGGDKLVGLSTHSIDQARAAVAAGADYVGVGPMFPSHTKAAAPVAGISLLKQVAAEIDVPHMAIGGITPDNIGQLAAAGGCCVAVCQAILTADDPQVVCRAVKEKLLAQMAVCDHFSCQEKGRT